MNIFLKGLSRYLTPVQISKIQSVSLGIGGAGGLGSNIAVLLARTGFSRFEIIDDDIIEASDLNRQQYFPEEIGRPKLDTLRQRLLKINPDVTFKAHNVRWTPANAGQFFNGCDFVIEAFDGAEDKARFIEFYLPRARRVISGNGMAGFLLPSPLTVKNIGTLYLVGDHATSAGKDAPPLAPRVTACAAMMAEIVLNLTLSS